MYALVIPKPPCSTDLHDVQVQSGSIGEKSAAKRACLRLRTPWAVIALPKRCSLSATWYNTERLGAYCCPSGPNAIEHVSAKSDSNHDIFRIADAHHVARLVLRQDIGASIDTSKVSGELACCLGRVLTLCRSQLWLRHQIDLQQRRQVCLA